MAHANNGLCDGRNASVAKKCAGGRSTALPYIAYVKLAGLILLSFAATHADGIHADRSTPRAKHISPIPRLRNSEDIETTARCAFLQPQRNNTCASKQPARKARCRGASVEGSHSEGEDVAKALPVAQSVDARRDRAARYFLSDRELGIIKVVDCSIVSDVQRTFYQIYGQHAEYNAYTARAVDRLLNELQRAGCHVLLRACRTKWPRADAVALSRIYQAMVGVLCRNRQPERALAIVTELLDQPLLLGAHMLQGASVAAFRTFVHGWIVPQLMMHAYHLYGAQFFMQIHAFTDFKQAANMQTDMADGKINKKEMMVEFKCARSNKQREIDAAMLHDTAMQAAVHARQFKLAVSAYFANVRATQQIAQRNGADKDATHFKVHHFKPDTMEMGVEQRRLGDYVKAIIGKISKIDNTIRMEPPDEKALENDLERIQNMDVGFVEQNHALWARTLMLRHALHNLFLTVDVTVGCEKDAEGRGNGNNDADMDVSPVLERYNNLEYLRELPTKYYHAIATKKMFKPRNEEAHLSVQDFVRYLNDDDGVQNNTEDPQKIINIVYKPLRTTFMRDHGTRGEDANTTLNATIRSLKQSGSALDDLSVTEIYAIMRKILSFGVSGAAAVSIFAIVFPQCRFQAWAHYHLLIAAFECDMERRDVHSMDRLLTLMGHWGCKPEPAVYARFFDICEANKRDDIIHIHANRYMIMTDEHDDADEHVDKRFKMPKRKRIAFQMYAHILAAYKRMGRTKQALSVFKHLLGAVHGIYRAIPDAVWQIVVDVMQDADVPKEMKAMVEQCQTLAKDADLPQILASYANAAQTYHRPVLTQQLEAMVDRYVGCKHTE